MTSHSPPPPRLGPRYAIGRAIGRGAFGVVWSAVDRVLKRPVAIKMLSAGRSLDEFKTLRSLTHPGIVEVLDVGWDPCGRPWFSMAMVEGEELGGPDAAAVPGERWYDAVARLLEAVAFLHDRGWVHGDLKSENVLRRLDGDAERIVVLDFGLALGADEGSSVRGTLGWIAPEVLAGAGVSQASDLYSLGLLAVRARGGRLPWDPRTPRPGLDAREPLPAGVVPEDTPEAVRSWLADLLRRDPVLRPKSARGALASLSAIAGRTLEAPGDAATRAAPTDLIAREDALAALAATAETGGVLVVEGPPGIGRTALLQTFFDGRRAQGLPTISLGLGGALDRARRSLAVFLHDPASTSPPSELDGGDSSTAGPPEDEGPSHDPVGAAARVQARVVALSEEIRAALSRLDGPLLVDDLDPDSVAGRAFIDALDDQPLPEGVILALRGADPANDVAAATRLLERRREPADARLRPAPWQPNEVRRRLEAALGGISEADALAALLFEGLGGLPRRVDDAIARMLVEGALFSGERGWRWTPTAVEALLADDAAERSADALRAPEDAARAAIDAARRAAALGEVFRAHGLLKAAGARPPLRDADPETLRPVLLERAEIAARCGEATDAAAQYRRVRAHEPDPRLQAGFLVKEAEALDIGAEPKEAIELLDEGAELLETAAAPEERARAAAVRAICLGRLGRFEEAEAQVRALLSREEARPQSAEDARPESTDDAPAVDRRIRLRLILANAAWHQGEAAEAIRICRDTHELLPSQGMDSARAAVETTLGTALWVSGRYAEADGALSVALERYRGLGRLLDCARVTNNLGIVRYEQGDWEGAIAAFEEFADLARRLGNVGERASALNNLGILHRDTGALQRAGRAFEESLRLARRHGFARLEPTVLGNQAEAAAVAGDRAEAERLYAESVALAAERGIKDEFVEALRRLAQVQLDDGDLAAADAALVRARQAVAEAPTRLEKALIEGLSAVLAGRRAEVGADAAFDEAVASLQAQGGDLEVARLRLRWVPVLLGRRQGERALEQMNLAEPVFRPLPARPELARLEALRKAARRASRSAVDIMSRHYGALQELTLALSRERELEPLLDLILARSLELLGEERGFVVLLDDRGRRILHAAHDIDTSWDAPLGAPSRSVVDRVLRERKAVVLLDAEQASGSLAQAPSLMSAGLRSAICVPILRADTLLGVIYVDGTTAVGDHAGFNQQLLQACADAASVAIENARLIDALRRKNEALAMLSHELRTPLASVIDVTTEMVEKGFGPDSDREGLAGVKRLAERMSGIVDEVLDLARRDAMRICPKRDPVDPLHLVVAARDSMQAAAARAGVHIDADVEEDLPLLQGEQDRLGQAVSNLLDNAIKHTPKGGTARLRAGCPDGRSVHLVIEDEGPGLPASTLEALSGTVPSQSLSVTQEGLAYGLGIARRIVLEHRGELRAENRPGGGGRIVIVLPVSTD